MKSSSIGVWTIILGVSAGCSQATAEDAANIGTASAAISAGIPDQEHKGVGALGFVDGGQFYAVCSGVLISPTVFLTAAHCTAVFPASGLTPAVTFDQKLTSSATVITGTAHTNPGYNPSRYNINEDTGDLGVIVLDQPVTNVPSTALPALDATKTLSAQAKVAAVGYGLRRPEGASSAKATYDATDERRLGEITFRSRTKAYLQATMLAVQGDDGLCFGDSGGPDYATIEGREQLVSISVVVNSYSCHSTAWLYRLDTPAARAFLGSYVTLP